MKILVVTPYLGSTYGGTSKAIQDLACSLAQENHSIDIVTTNANDKVCIEVPLNQWIEKDGYRVRYFPCWNRNTLIVSPQLLWWIFRHAEAYDVVHTNTIFSPIISLTHSILRSLQVPYVVTPHGMLEPWALNYKSWKKRYYLSLFEKSNLKQASAIQALASTEAQNILQLDSSLQIAVVPNGIHKESFVDAASPDTLYEKFPEVRGKTLILFLGRIDPKKGLDLLSTAFADVYQRYPNAHLAIAGPDSINYLPTARQFFAEAGCSSAVTFTGMITGELKQAALAAADVYVAPSYSEGFSISVLEGMASGLPCVITTGCNFPEAASAEAAYVVDIDAGSICAAIEQCLEDEIAAKALGDRARNFIFENYTWKKSAERLTQVYSSISRSTTPSLSHTT